MSATNAYLQAGTASGAELLRQQEALVQEHAGLVRRIAYHLVSRMPSSVEVDDLIQAGMIGLLDAARHYAADRGASFETYAGIRIRGAMLDEVRRSDWTPRWVHRSMRELGAAMREVEARSGSEAQPAEVASAAGVTLDEYHRILQHAMSCRLFSLEDLRSAEEPEVAVADPGPGPAGAVENERFRAALAEVIGSLPEREQLILALYYDEELNLREIGEVLGVTESRVCQIHSQAVLRIRSRMHDWTAG